MIWYITCLLFRKGKFQKHQMKKLRFLCPWLYKRYVISKVYQLGIQVLALLYGVISSSRLSLPSTCASLYRSLSSSRLSLKSTYDTLYSVLSSRRLTLPSTSATLYRVLSSSRLSLKSNTVKPFFSRGSFFRAFPKISIRAGLIFALSHCGRFFPFSC